MRSASGRTCIEDKVVPLVDGEIDAGLLLLLSTPASAGRSWSHREIAFVCDCSRSYIWLLEQSALAKLKRELERRGLDEEIMKLVA